MNFNEYLLPVAVMGCLVIGYCIKRIPSLKINDYIPSILAIVGALIACVTNGFSVQSAIAGAFSGLASTGLHQALTRFIEALSGKEQ